MAIDIGVGLSTDTDPILAAKEAVRLASVNLHNKKASLAIVFSSVELACASLLKTISGSLDERVPIIGCSAAAIISNQGLFKHGLVVMLLGFPQDVHFNACDIKEIKARGSLLAGEELGQRLLSGLKDTPRDLSIIFSDGLLQENSNFIHGLQEKLGKSFPLVGASASDNFMFKKTYVYFNKEAFSEGACGILFGGKLNFGLGIKHGWRPLGKPRYVTKSSANIVYEIDDAPAAGVYEDYFASDLNGLKKKLKYISILYPIGISLPNEEEYLLRNLLAIQDDGSLVFQGDVPEGSLCRLMIGTKESCLAATEAAAKEAKRGLLSQSADYKKREAKDFVLVFDSVSRYILLRRSASKELEIIKEQFGKDTPIIGIYTYGEQAPLRAIDYHGETYAHNQTIAILAVGA